MRAPSRRLLREAADDFLEAARSGSIRSRSGKPYKPSTLRSYEIALRLRIPPDLGAARLSEIARADVQRLVDRLLGQGLDASTIRNALMPLRAIYRRALARGEVALNPTTGLDLPAVEGRRERIAPPEEAARLLAALPVGDRALWVTAMYAGLRGELAALRWEDVDLAAGYIRVERAWDVKAGPIEPKSRAGGRRVPIAAVLRDHLLERKLGCACRDQDEGLVFGRSAQTPFEPVTVAARARSAWEAAGLEPITLHEARHTFASLMIAAGVNAKTLSTWLGHSSVAVTLDRYAKLIQEREREEAELLDAYLERAATQARLAQLS